MTDHERKAVPFAEFKVDASSGEFSGYASIFGNVDSGGDIVVKGAYQKAIPAFLRDGFISWSHDWSMPIAMPTDAVEDDKGLFLAGRFHSTPAAQEARTITAERAANGKRTGLSIGYDIEDYAPDGKGHRLLKVINPLFEVGFVMVPMNRESNLAAVKADLRELSLDAGSSLAGAVARFLGDADALTAQFAKMADLRSKEGRSLSAANRQRLAEIRQRFADGMEAIEQILAETDSGKADVAVLAAIERARSLGIKLN
jgi:hypothetical protein